VGRAEGLHEQMLGKTYEAKAIATAAAAEGRELTAAELARMEKLLDEAEGFKAQAERAFAAGDSFRGQAGIGLRTMDGQVIMPFRSGGGSGSRPGATLPGGLRVLKPGERMADYVAEDPALAGVTLGRIVRGIVTGETEGLGIRAQMSEGVSGGGAGYLVPAPLSAQVIDLARNQARVIEAGAQTVPMTSSTLTLARQTGDPDAEWKSEGAAVSSTTGLTFDRVVLTARTLFAVANMTIELVEDAANAEPLVEAALAKKFALELDRVALRGSGVPPEPMGILSTDGFHAIGGSLTNYDSFSYAVEAIRTSNEEPNAVIYGAGVAGALDRLKDLQDQPLRPPASFTALRQLVSNQTIGEAFIADWTQLLIGMRTNIMIEASRTASDGDGSAFTSGRVLVRAYMRADVALARPGAFAVIDGLGGVSS
jgi:HK97 family phage major capsid protein